MLHFLIRDDYEEGEWWLALGEGTTPEIDKAYRYPAACLRKAPGSDTIWQVINDEGGVEHELHENRFVLAPEHIGDVIRQDKMISLLDNQSQRMLRDATAKLDKAEDKLTELEKAGKLLLTPTDSIKVAAELLKDLKDVKYVEGKKPVWPLGADFLASLGIDAEPEPEPEKEPVSETTVLESGQKLTHHAIDVCFPDPCPLHSPTRHPLYLAPRRWMKEKMWRDCVHGVSHPDPDDLKVREIPHERLHSCCVEKCCGLD